jgi:hypothetical protein
MAVAVPQPEPDLNMAMTCRNTLPIVVYITYPQVEGVS